MTEYQTRGNGELSHFSTLKEAYDYAMTHDVWKISDNEDRIKYIRSQNDMNLINRSKKYANCSNPEQVFWVDESMSVFLDQVELISTKITISKMIDPDQYKKYKSEMDKLKSGEAPIRECLTDEEFREKYL